MPLSVQCTNCNKRLQVPDALAGKRGKCPNCQTVLQIPLGPMPASQQPTVQKAMGKAPSVPESEKAVAALRPSPAAATPVPSAGVRPDAATTPGLLDVGPQADGSQPSRKELQRQILTGLGGRIEDVELTSDYKFGATLLACVMVALVIIYILMTVGAGVFIAWFSLVAVNSLREAAAAGRGVIFPALVYFALWTAAVLMFVALVRPLFARGDGDERRRTITRDSDPLVHHFVERIAAAVGAPVPSRIDVNTDVNASAGFRGGLFRPSQSELVLTLGLSLVAGLNSQQFAGVLAHELGHFTQKSSVRLTMLVKRISMWMGWASSSAYWDYKLAQFGGCLFLITFPARLLMRVPQWILRGLMMLSYLVCGYMVRQQEYDADRFETRVSGSACYETTARRLEVLGVAYRQSIGQLQFNHTEGRLGDNLPLLVLSNARQLPEKVHRELRRHIAKGKTGLFDSHPCARERIEAARKENSPGIYHVDLPAHLLFTNFLGLARNATWDFYRGIFGPSFQQSEMHPIGDLLERIEQEENSYKTLHRYFQGTFSVLRPIRLQGSTVDVPKDVKEAVAAMQRAREKVVSIAEAHRAVLKRFRKNDMLIVESTQARELLRSGFRVRKSDFSVPLGNIDTVTDVRRQAVHRMNGVCRELVQYEEAHSIRLWSALQLMHVEKVAGRMGGAGKLRSECSKLVSALAFINGKSEDLIQMRNTHAGLQALFTKLGSLHKQDLVNELVREIKDVYQRLARLRESLLLVGYPFDHANRGTTMADYALPAMPERDDIIQIYQAAEQLGMAMVSFYPRLAGRLAIMAEQVETLFGLAPLPEPPEEEDEEDEEEQAGEES